MESKISGTDIPIIDDIVFEDLMRDPYPVYKRAQAMGPIVRIEAANLLLVTHFDDILEIEHDPETFSSDNPESNVVKLFGPNLMRKDGEAHKRERKAIEPTMRPGTATRCWGPVLEGIVDEVISAFEKKGEADLFDALAAPISGRALAAVVGFDDVSWQTIAAWSQGMMDGAGNYSGDPKLTARALEVSREIEAAVDRNTRRLLEAPDESLLSSMLQAGLTTKEIYGNTKVAVGGGYNEPRDAILSLIYGLLLNPDQKDKVVADPTLWQPAFEEAVRWISPIGMYPRLLTRDVEIGGHTVPKGTQIGLSVAAANHEEPRFEAPQRYNAFRPKAQHLAFGSGSHFCAGTWVARVMVTRIVAPQVFARLKNLRLKDPDLVTIRGWVFRGPTSLPVVWDV
ncbi:cytochrome P450 [Thalassospira lucentensis]|uniref:cytochrome P450 n=1 Tax=Thalassospira lucentensis TaxID=168935 RepID=UPI0003B393B4|nr:cytochrome P450 [Thalassospira lucentensis]RCK21759.1 cytochrome P450 [Thalassospira lucentensis MCCC 1A00383 = DSM 14000]